MTNFTLSSEWTLTILFNMFICGRNIKYSHFSLSIYISYIINVGKKEKRKKVQKKYEKNTGQNRTQDPEFVRMGYILVKYFA